MLGFLNTNLSLKNAKMNYVALRPLRKNINRLLKHISTPLASFVADKQSYMSERFTDCHTFMIQVLCWCHADQANRDQHVLCPFSPLKSGHDLIRAVIHSNDFFGSNGTETGTKMFYFSATEL